MSDIKKSKGFCLFCISECGVLIDHTDQNIIRIRPDPDDPISQGYVCEKSQKIKQYQEDPDRITQPMKRVNGKLIPISWNQALDEIAERLKECRTDRIFYMPVLSPNYDSNALYLYELVHRMGSRYMSNILGVEKIYQHLAQNLIFDRTRINDVKNSQTMLIIGQNTWNINPFPRTRIIMNEIRNDPNRKMIAIDPCENETTRIADRHVAINPGSDAWFLLAMLYILQTRFDREFIDEWVINSDRILKHINSVDLSECSRITGQSIDQLKETAQLIGSAESLTVHTGNGLCHTPFPMVTYYLATILPILLGHVDRPGCLIHGPNFGQKQRYFRETRTPFTGRLQIDGITGAGEVVENLYRNEEDKFDAIITDNCNPIARYPNTDQIKKQFRQVGLHVALDSFMSATTETADYVLPTPTYLERYECVNATTTADRGWIQLNQPTVQAPELSRTSWQIYEALLERLNLVDHNELESSQARYNRDPQEFIGALVEDFKTQHPTTLFRLQHTLGQRFVDPLITMTWWQLFLYKLENVDIKTAYHETEQDIDQFQKEGKLNLHPELNQRPRSKINLRQEFYLSAMKLDKSKLTNSKYPFVVMPGVRQQGTLNMILKNTRDPYVEINEQDAERLGVVNDDQVKIVNPNGSIIMPAVLTSSVPRSVLRIYNNRDLNFITNSQSRDHLNPQYKFVFARVESVA